VDPKNQDEFFWAKIQAQRFMRNPWEPGTSIPQSPSHMVVFNVLPAEGCEQMNVGICAYPKHVWKAGGEPSWSLVFDNDAVPESRKIMKAFQRRWKLRRLPESESSTRQRFGPIETKCYCTSDYLAAANVHKGIYLSHRKGYGKPIGIVTLRDSRKGELLFRFSGSEEQAIEAFSSPPFQADLERLVHGGGYVTPALTGVWGSFCKSQYANAKGINNFIKAHLSICAILEHMQGLGFEVKVTDEGTFWEKRDIAALTSEIEEWDAVVAAMAGALKDQAASQGAELHSAMDGRSDFERLEMKGQGLIADFLKRFKVDS